MIARHGKNKNSSAAACFTKPIVILLCFLWTIAVVAQFIWLKGSGHPPHGNGIEFILRGMEFAFQFQTDGLLALLRSMFLQRWDFFSLLDLLHTLYYIIFGISSEMELMIPILFLGIGIIGIYGVGALLFTKDSGIAAAIIFISMIDVIASGRFGGYHEHYIMCLLPLIWFFLERSNSFAVKKDSILAGILIGLCITIKYIASIWIIALVVFYVLRKPDGKGRIENSPWQRIVNMLSCMGMTFLITSLWYWRQLPVLLNAFTMRVHSDSIQKINFSLDAPFFYLNSLRSEMVSSSVIAFVAIALLYVIIRALIKRHMPEGWGKVVLVFVLTITPLAFFSSLTCKFKAHIIPISAFTSVFIASIYDLIGPKIIRCVFLILLCAHALFIQYGATAYVFPVAARTNVILKVSVLDRLGEILERRSVSRVFGALKDSESGQSWDKLMKETLLAISNDAGIVHAGRTTRMKVPNVLVLANCMPMRFFQFQYYNAKLTTPLMLQAVLYEKIYWDDAMSDMLLYQDPLEYIITEDFDSGWEDNGGENYGIAETRQYIHDHQEEFNKTYQSIMSIATHRGSQIKIYRKKVAENNMIAE